MDMTNKAEINLYSTNFTYWAQRKTWKDLWAAFLLAGIDPRGEEPTPGWYEYELPSDRPGLIYPDDVRVWQERIYYARESGELPPGEKSPLEWVMWALNVSKLEVPGALVWAVRAELRAAKKRERLLAGKALMPPASEAQLVTILENLEKEKGSAPSKAWFEEEAKKQLPNNRVSRKQLRDLHRIRYNSLPPGPRKKTAA